MNRVLQFIGLLFIIVVFSLVPELIGGDLSDMLKAKLGKNYHYFVIGAGIIALMFYTLWTDGGRIFGTKRKANSKIINTDYLAKIHKNRLHTKATKIAIIYHHKDENHAEKLLQYLQRLKSQMPQLELWSINELGFGDISESLQKEIENTDRVLYLVSIDALTDKYLQDMVASARRQGKVVTLILIRSCLYKDEPLIADLEVLPKEQYFINKSEDTDEAWTAIVSDIGQSLGISLNTLKTADATPVQQTVLDDIRKGLLDSYQKRLKSKMAYRFPINLEIEYSTEGSDAKVPLYDNVTIQDKAIRASIAEVFDDHNGRLLIIGQPGSGKTTLLLELACALMQSETEQIPIIVNIATWRSRFKTVENWLSELLPQMGFSKALTKQLLDENRLLLLLDGLDELKFQLDSVTISPHQLAKLISQKYSLNEVNTANREICLKAIAQFGKEQKARYVICSRIEEYAATVDAPVYCQIKVKPLTIPQIEQGLQTTPSPESKGILQAIKQDLLLAKAIQTPFYFNTIQLLFASMKSWTEFGFSAKESAGRKEEIISTFVEETSNRFYKHSPADSKKWLGFLAYQMNTHGLVSFELLDVQYDWAILSKGQKRWAAFLNNLLVGLVVCLLGSPLFGLFGSLFRSPLYGLFTGLLFGLFGGLLVGPLGSLLFALLGGAPQKNIFIHSKDRINWSFSRFWFFIKKESKDILLGGRFVGLLFGLPTGLIVGLLGSPLFGLLVGLFVGSLFGLLFALLDVLFVGSLFGLIDQLKNTQSYLKITTPYQRFKASAWRFHFSILQHWHLRGILRRQGLLPRKLVPFLNEATKHHILEKDGGTWRFRHGILQDYFADYYQKNHTP